MLLLCFFSGCRLNFLSINRFERKKNIELAISAFSMLCSPNGLLKNQDTTDASLIVVGQCVFLMTSHLLRQIDRYYGDAMFIINCCGNVCHNS